MEYQNLIDENMNLQLMLSQKQMDLHDSSDETFWIQLDSLIEKGSENTLNPIKDNLQEYLAENNPDKIKNVLSLMLSKLAAQKKKIEENQLKYDQLNKVVDL